MIGKCYPPHIELQLLQSVKGQHVTHCNVDSFEFLLDDQHTQACSLCCHATGSQSMGRQHTRDITTQAAAEVSVHAATDDAPNRHTQQTHNNQQQHPSPTRDMLAQDSPESSGRWDGMLCNTNGRATRAQVQCYTAHTAAGEGLGRGKQARATQPGDPCCKHALA